MLSTGPSAFLVMLLVHMEPHLPFSITDLSTFVLGCLLSAAPTLSFVGYNSVSSLVSGLTWSAGTLSTNLQEQSCL